MKTILFFASSLLLVFASTHTKAIDIYFKASMFAYSETSSITQIVLDDLEGNNFDGGEFSYTHNTWEIGAIENGFKLAAIARYDYFIEYSPDAAELIFNEKNALPIENRLYDISIQALNIRALGIKFGYQYSLSESLIIGGDISALTSSGYLDGSVNGDLDVQEDSYSGLIQLEQIYSKDRLLDRIANAPDAQGYSLDLFLNWKPSEDISLNVSWLDLKSSLEIDRALYTSATADSDRVDLDSNGRVDVKPILSGREGFASHELVYPKQFVVNVGYDVNQKISTGLRYLDYAGYKFLASSMNYQIGDDHDGIISFDFQTEAVTLGLSSSAWAFSITSDKINLNEAYTFGLSFSFSQEI